jgi:tetratricopeptide (TPR) repeat protein
MRKYIIFLIPILVIAAGAVFFYISGQGIGVFRKQEFKIDFENLEKLAENHPVGEEIISKIRENEKLLRDDDKSNDVSAYLNIGFDMRQLGDDEMAILAYLRALEVDPEHPLGLNNIATSYREIGEYAKAEEAYRRAIISIPGEISNYINLADVYRIQHPDDEEGLLAIINSGVEVVGGPYDLISYLAVYYRDRGDAAKAIEYFEKLLSVSPGNESIKAEIERLRGE